MNCKDKLKLYFFNPYDDEEKYSSFYRSITDKNNIVGYSPLYMLRRHILFMSGQLPINKDYKPYFSAIILSNIAISGMLELLNYKKQEGENDFYNKYLGKNPIQVLGLKILRNTLVHNNFMLFIRLLKEDNRTKYYYNSLLDYLEETGRIPDNSKIKTLKVAFNLYDSLKGNLVLPPEVERIYEKEEYALVRYFIAPFDYLKKFEQMFPIIKKDILHNHKLLKRFNEQITVDNWMGVKSVPDLN